MVSLVVLLGCITVAWCVCVSRVPVRAWQVGTLNYMAPEALSWSSSCGSRVKMGRASDVWSLGCILYQMVYGATPFASITNVVHKVGRGGVPCMRRKVYLNG